MAIHSSQLERLAENTMYHYDAAFFYEGVASGEIVIPIDPEFPPPEEIPVEGAFLAARDAYIRGRTGAETNGAIARRAAARANGNGDTPAAEDGEAEPRKMEPRVPPSAGSRAFTPEEIEELNELSNVHLSAAIQLDEVIAFVSESTGGGETEEILTALERAMPKRGALGSTLRRRIYVPGRPTVEV